MDLPENLSDEMYMLKTSTNQATALNAFKDDDIMWSPESTDTAPSFEVLLSELPGYTARITALQMSLANVALVIFDVGVMDKNHIKLGVVSEVFEVRRYKFFKRKN